MLDHGRLVAEGTAGRAQAAASRGGHIRLQFADPSGLEAAAARARRGRAATTTRSPSRSRATAASTRCATLLDRLDATSIEVESLSVHTPDLDDVFLALTGNPTRKGRDEHH